MFCSVIWAVPGQFCWEDVVTKGCPKWVLMEWPSVQMERDMEHSMTKYSCGKSSHLSLNVFRNYLFYSFQDESSFNPSSWSHLHQFPHLDLVENEALKIKKWDFFIWNSSIFLFSLRKQTILTWSFAKKNLLMFLMSLKFSICWPALPAHKDPCLCPPPTLLRMRYCWLKALRARVSKQGDSRWPQNKSSESGHCCVSQLARSPRIGFGKSSVADLFLSESFISVYLSLPTPAPAWWPQYSEVMLLTSLLISGAPGC